MESRLLNGPRRARGKEEIPSILRRKAYVSCRGYVSIPIRARRMSEGCAKQGGTAGSINVIAYPVLDRSKILSRTFFVCVSKTYGFANIVPAHGLQATERYG